MESHGIMHVGTFVESETKAWCTAGRERSTRLYTRRWSSGRAHQNSLSMDAPVIYVSKNGELAPERTLDSFKDGYTDHGNPNESAVLISYEVAMKASWIDAPFEDLPAHG